MTKQPLKFVNLQNIDNQYYEYKGCSNRLLKAITVLVVNGIDIDLYARLNVWLLKKIKLFESVIKSIIYGILCK